MLYYKVCVYEIFYSLKGIKMNIIIIGGGKVGETLCREISSESNCDVTLIEKNEKVLDKMQSKFDIQGIAGSGTSVDTLREAGIENCDFFIAVSQKDETNIIACIMAKKLGAKYTIARVREREYSAHIDFVKESLGISKIINPDLEASYDIYRMMKYIHATSVEVFMDNKVSMVGIVINEDSKITNMYLKDFRKLFDVIVCIIQRDMDVFIPTGESQILDGDIIYVTGSSTNMQNFYAKVGYMGEKTLKSVLIVGGGKLSSYLLPLLKRMNIDIKVIELDYKRAKKLSEQYSDVSVICGDGTDQDFLDEMMIENQDCCISLTGIDEENALISMFAAQRGVKKTITKINRLAILKVIRSEEVKSIITPKRIIADAILRSIRSIKNVKGSNVEQLYTLAGDEVQALQFKAHPKSKLIGKSLETIKLKNNTIIAVISRNNTLFFPTGKDAILEEDKVLVVTKHIDFSDLDDILERE